MTRCQEEPDDGGQFAHPTTDLDEPQPERVELDALHPSGDQPASQRIEQPVDGGVQQQPELVRHKGVATQPIREAVALQLLDPVLRLTTRDVLVIDGLRRDVDWTIGDDEARIGSLGQRLGLVDDAPFDVPTA